MILKLYFVATWTKVIKALLENVCGLLSLKLFRQVERHNLGIVKLFSFATIDRCISNFFLFTFLLHQLLLKCWKAIIPCQFVCKCWRRDMTNVHQCLYVRLRSLLLCLIFVWAFTYIISLNLVWRLRPS